MQVFPLLEEWTPIPRLIPKTEKTREIRRQIEEVRDLLRKGQTEKKEQWMVKEIKRCRELETGRTTSEQKTSSRMEEWKSGLGNPSKNQVGAKTTPENTQRGPRGSPLVEAELPEEDTMTKNQQVNSRRVEP